MPFDISDFKTEQPKSPAQTIQVIGGGGSSMDLTDFNIDEFFKSIKPDVEAPQPVPPVSNDYSSSSSTGMYHFGSRRQEQSSRSDSGGHYGQQQQQQLKSYQSPPPQTASGFQQQIPRPPSAVNTQQHATSYQDDGDYNNSGYNNQQHGASSSFQQRQTYHQSVNQSFGSHNMPLAPPPLPPSNLSINSNNGDEYNPDTWEMSWASSVGDDSFQVQETPVSPPHFERKAGANVNVIEYVDPHSDPAANGQQRGAGDVDHRQLHIPPLPQLAGGGAPVASAISKEKVRAIDVDHRNLISLTGSPRTDSGVVVKTPLLPLQPPNMWKGDTVSYFFFLFFLALFLHQSVILSSSSF